MTMTAAVTLILTLLEVYNMEETMQEEWLRKLGDTSCGGASVLYIDIEEQIGSGSLALVPGCFHTRV
jgi:hypothetical protein